METSGLLCDEKLEYPKTVIRSSSNNAAIISLAIPGATYRIAELLQMGTMDSETQKVSTPMVISKSFVANQLPSVEDIVKSIPKITFPLLKNVPAKPADELVKVSIPKETVSVIEAPKKDVPNVLIDILTAPTPDVPKEKKKPQISTPPDDDDAEYIPNEEDKEVKVKRKRGRPKRAISPPKQIKRAKRTKAANPIVEKEILVIEESPIPQGSLFPEKAPDEKRMEEAMRCLNEAVDVSGGSPSDKIVKVVKEQTKISHKSKFTYTYLIDTDGSVVNITGYGTQHNPNWPISEGEIESALKRINKSTAYDISGHITEAEVFLDIGGLERYNAKTFIFYIGKGGWSFIPIANTRASIAILNSVISNTITASQLNKQTEMLPCLGKVLFQIKCSEPIPQHRDLKIPLSRETTNDDIKVVMLKCTGEVSDIRLPSMSRKCVDSSVSDRIICSISVMLRSYGYKGFETTHKYTPAADLVEETHGIYVCYLQKDGKTSREASKISVTNFVVIERLVKLSQERKIYLPTDIPVMLFRVCGGIVMNLTSHDIRCILVNS